MKRSVHRLLCAVLGCILLLGVLAGANTAMAETAASGKCGKDLVWSFDPATGVITIEGEGAMWDYDSARLRLITVLPRCCCPRKTRNR